MKKELKKNSLCKKISMSILFSMIILIIAITIYSQKEVLKTTVSQINLNEQNEYKLSATIEGVEWYYDLDDDGNAINVHYKEGDLGENVVIPQTLDGHIVLKIEYKEGDNYKSIFGDKSSSVKTVIIPESVTSIGNYVFSGCTGLTEIEIPNSVTSIGRGAFLNCSRLTEITIPSGVTSIEQGVFGGCSRLTEITIPNAVTSIGHNAFSGCGSLTKIEIPRGVTSIGEDAFSMCSSLTEIAIPNGITRIEKTTFEYCRSLTEITIPNSVTSIGSHAFCGCSSLREITIPRGVTSIECNTFGGCSNITEIRIPNSVTSIEEDVFGYCISLTKIVIPSSVTSIGENAFNNCDKLTIYTSSDYVASYAEENNINYELDNTPPTVKITAYKSNDNENIGEQLKETIEFNTNGTYSVSQWTNTGVWFKLEASDDLTMESNWKWNRDNIYENIQEEYDGGSEDYPNADEKYKSITSPGWRKAQYTVIDALGNSTVVKIEVKIEQEKPSLEIGEYTKEWTNQDIIIPITATDNISGLAEVKVNENILNANNGQERYTVTENGKYTIEATDIAGNKETKEVEINNIDKISPTITVEGNSTEWTKEDITLKVNAKDEQSGLADKAYSFDGGNTWQIENERIYTENTNNIIIKVKDKVGNIIEYEPISITKIIKLTNIRIKQEPSKKTYEEGGDFNPEGMKIEAIYNNGAIEEITNYQVTNGENLELGQTSVTISYTENGVTKTVEQSIEVLEKELNVEVKVYETTIEAGKKYIEKIKPDTTIETIKRNIETNGTVEVYKESEEIRDSSVLICTGMEIVVKLKNEEVKYIAVVTGDLTGNGKIGIGDLLKLSRYAAGLDKTLNGAYLRASDVVRDGKYGSISDILKISRVLAKMDNI